jgi:hypothetical protein
LVDGCPTFIDVLSYCGKVRMFVHIVKSVGFLCLAHLGHCALNQIFFRILGQGVVKPIKPGRAMLE